MTFAQEELHQFWHDFEAGDGEEEPLTTLNETLQDIINGFRRSRRMSHAGVVLTGCAALDGEMKRILLAALPQSNGKIEKRLFDGPLQSLSAKIDLAHAMGLTTKATHDELRKICEIRNDFAHPKAGLPNLDDEPMASKFKQLRIPHNATGESHQRFLDWLSAISRELKGSVGPTLDDVT